MSDLYFIANTALGIVKIGIAESVEQRRRGLECSCGVPLEVLGVLKDGGHHERALHDAFGDSRLLGEWFTPTDELLRLALKPESVPAYLTENRERIRAWREKRDIAIGIEREAERIATQAARDEIKRIKAEAKRAAAKQEARMQKMRDTKAANRAARAEAQRVEWAAKCATLPDRVVKPAEMAIAARRRLDLSEQRTRNAAMLGVMPYETQRGASMGAPKDA